MDIVTLLNIFNCYSSIFPMFPNNEKQKNCFLAACKIWDQNINLEEIDQNFPHRGLIGYGNSFLDFFLARSKVFRLHAILHDSAGAVKATTNQDRVIVTCYLNFRAHVSWVTLLLCSFVSL